MGGWTIGLEFMLRGKRTFIERESRLQREREGGGGRERALVGGRDPIHCVARIFAGYSIA